MEDDNKWKFVKAAKSLGKFSFKKTIWKLSHLSRSKREDWLQLPTLQLKKMNKNFALDYRKR